MAFYAVILDSGSGGTRAFMYRITPKVAGIAGQVQVITSDNQNLETRPGIHMLQNGGAVGPYLQDIFTAVDQVLGGLPGLPRKLYVLATAGVRGLNADQQQNLGTWVRDHIQALPGFDSSEYRTISGTEEAKYGWIAANYSQGRGFDAGYVEMGGASAQIAIPITHILLPTARVVARCLNEANMQRVVVAQPGWARENLDAVVRLWAGDVQRANVEGLWGNPAQLAAAEIELNLGNQAKLERVGERWLFFASYRLGTQVGRDKYEAIMFGQIPGLTDQQRAQIVDPNNPNIFYDPSQRQGYNKPVGPRFIRGIQNQQQKGPQSKLARTTFLVQRVIRDLFPLSDQEAATAFDAVVKDLDFIGASNFWWSMKPAAPGPLTLNAFSAVVRNSSNLTNEQFRAGKTEDEIQKLENNIFKAIWGEYVLSQAFGIPLQQNQQDHQLRNIVFTPYNGAGPDNGRFSWTLGTAVLLASEDLANLDPIT